MWTPCTHAMNPWGYTWTLLLGSPALLAVRCALLSQLLVTKRSSLLLKQRVLQLNIFGVVSILGLVTSIFRVNCVRIKGSD